ncbi:DMT family transporter [Sphingomonas aracearum]|uniref:DMT family transporter n=1 Tax=Sphingomonas aracearum TaxID=2283317 RepID=A0A369VTZ1_9SPHN|nr:DMT family transporter [Sphingomonas aracearum]RDE05854.1 DMT family transporter [Sphingomonas aracearum]
MHHARPPRKTLFTATVLAYVALVVANVALAFGPLFVRLADVGPVASAFWRIALALPLLFVLAGASGWRGGGTRGLWPAILIGGVAFAADLASWHLGILRTTLANATLFGNCAVLFFPLYGFVAARAWPSRLQAVALLLAAAGGGLLMGRSLELGARNLTGDLLCLAAGLLYTIYFIAMRRVRLRLPPLPALALSSAASLLPLAVFAVAFGETLWPGHWSPLFGLALVSQVIGQGAMIFALGRVSPLLLGIALLLQPVCAAIIGLVAFDERLGAADAVGAVLVAVALVLVRDRSAAVAPDAAEEQKQA